jgi:IclR family KDG regulon transcriptional repressor
MKKNTNSKRSLVQSVERALLLLDTLAQQDNGLTLVEISERVGLHTSTAYRILATLVAYDFVRQDPDTKAYQLGFQLLRFGQIARQQLDLRSESMEALTTLAHQAEELANLVVRSGAEVTYVAQVNSRHSGSLRMFTQLGVSAPVYCTAVGKAILAHLPEEEREQFFNEEEFTAYTAHTITNPLQLRQEIEIVQERGYAVDNEERELGVRCVASPVLDSTDRVVAAVGISGPSGRLMERRVPELSQFVVKAASDISRQLGYKGDLFTRYLMADEPLETP